MDLPSSSSKSSSFEASEPHLKSTTPRSGKYLRTQVQYQLNNLTTAAGAIAGGSSLPKTPDHIVLSSPTPMSRQPTNYKHGTGSIFPSNLKSITSSVVSDSRPPFSFSAAAASTTASQLSTVTIAGPVFSSLHPRTVWQRLEVDSMASPRVAYQSSSPVAQSKAVHAASPRRQRQLEGSGGVEPKSSTTARECVIEARRIVQHFVSGACSEAAFCSVIGRSAFPPPNHTVLCIK